MGNGFHLHSPIRISWVRLFICLPLLPFLASSENRNESAVAASEFHALLALKNEFVDLRGVLRGWNGNDSAALVCSGWVGVKCVNGHVAVVQLPWKGFGGRISDSIGRLRYLRRLSLHDNFLQGPVPESLGRLHNLRGVYLFNNRLSGSIPPSIGECPVLQTLDLSNNLLTGFIPPSLANSTRLYKLNLSFNAISGPIPVSFSQSPSLSFLALQHNNISGSMPDEWGSKPGDVAYKLQSLVVDHNLLSGKIPSTLTRLAMLQELKLGHNSIVGSLPDDLGNLSQLSFLDLSNNAISGRLPESLSKLSSLKIMNLESNNLEYEIPVSLGNLTSLSVLDLSGNKFRGPIPDALGNISSIASLDLSRNNLTGEIPESLVNLQNLSFLDLSFNNLSGQVPSILALRFTSSSFTGNSLLCGYSSSNTCSSAAANITSPPPRESKAHKNRKLSAKDIVLISAGALLILLLVACCVLLCCLIRRKLRTGRRGRVVGRNLKPVAAVATEVESGGESGGKLVHFDGPLVFTADDLLCATAEITGKSAYGTAYKATMEDNNNVAVKRLRERLTKPQREFETEVAQLGKIRHPNILALRAYYLGPKGEKLLVYDYMPNGSLASFLHARGPETIIGWPTRMNIAIGIARALSHLHTQESIVHGNLTSSTIFLDETYTPKVADAGISRLMTTTAATDAPATSGTTGYRAPELAKPKSAPANTKTDVFSLGVILLELLTGKSPSDSSDGLDLPQRVASIVKEEWTHEVFDVELITDAPSIGDELLNTLKLALHCVDPSPSARPDAPQLLQRLQEIRHDPAKDDDDVSLAGR